MSIQRIAGVYLADSARVTGDVELGSDANIWYGAVVRGDVARISIGEGTNIQDNAIVHCDSGVPHRIGRHVTVGHAAIIHGKSIGDGTLIGMHATVLGQTVIGRGCLIAAGAVVPPGMHVPDGSVVMGVPGRIIRPVNDKEREYLAWLAPHYVKLARLYYEQPSHPRCRPWTGNAPLPTTIV